MSTGSGTGITAAVAQENLLHQTYNITLPPYHNRDVSLVPGVRDACATMLLHTFKPTVLEDYIPLAIHGDGNCLFRAVSRALYGDEKLHTLLRLMAALEIACNPASYDPSRPDFCNSITDSATYVPPYIETLKTTCKLGTDSELIHLYATCAVIGKPIQSVYPMSNRHIDPWNRLVVGRNVMPQPAITILWSSSQAPTDADNFTPNHFVLLYQISHAANIQTLPCLPVAHAPSPRHRTISPDLQQTPDDTSPAEQPARARANKRHRQPSHAVSTVVHDE